MSESYESAAFLLSHLPDLPDGVLHGDWIDFPTIIGDRSWSSGEWVLITASQDMWNGAGACTIRQALASLDDHLFAVLLAALQMRRPSPFTTNLLGAS